MTRRPRPASGLLAAAALTLTCLNAVAYAGSADGSPTVDVSAEITYLHDVAHPAQRCSGPPTGDLHYVVFSPAAPGNYPVVFGMQGTVFRGAAECGGNGKEKYRALDRVMAMWAERGFVAVNIEYHGTNNGLHGDDSYRGTRWGKKADGTTELNIKPAVKYFFAHNPAQWGADESLGLVAFGGSSGGHNAHMLAETSPFAGHAIASAIGYSGLPDEADIGPDPQAAYLDYMCGAPTCDPDVANFGDPIKRLRPSSPPQYAANSVNEDIQHVNAETFIDACRHKGVPACWVRIVAGNGHATAYVNQAFDPAHDGRVDPASQGRTVFDDTVAFAESTLPS